MIKKSVLTIVGVFFLTSLKAQDGSNIIYYEPNNLDSTLIGKQCHIDFGQVSYRGLRIDTLEINVKGKGIKFYEHRVDNGYENWFSEQYLIGHEQNQVEIRLVNSKIDNLTSDRIYVTSTLSYYYKESLLDTITVFQHWYERKNVSKVLIKK